MLNESDVDYDLLLFANHTHQMYLNILLMRTETSKVLHQVPRAPNGQPSSPISVCSSPLTLSPLNHSFYVQEAFSRRTHSIG